METKEKEKTSEPKFLNLHDLELKKIQWIKLINRNFRVLYKHRDERNYSLIGAGTVFKLTDFKNALEAFSKAMESSDDIITFDVKNVVRFKFYTK